jgi:hypothetical protein
VRTWPGCACQFVGAHNLDRLRIEGAPLFARTPGWWRARRKTLAEEQHWRANRQVRWRPTCWYPRACHPPASPEVEAPEVLEPARLAALYRELRKGREDAKDEPGAADFYYGECEMRRHDPGIPRAERLVLWAYWMLSGYGLRGLRALGFLVMAFVCSTLVLRQWGFQSLHRPWGSAVLYTAGALTHLVSPPDRLLNEAGQAVRIVIGLAGPVLLGLALLSIRGRVRR